MKAIPMIIASLFLFTSLISCNRKAAPGAEAADTYKPALVTAAGPPVIVYKTKSDFRHNVPIILSADKKEILMYPAPGDVFYQGEYAMPFELRNGYLLDRRGINENAAFLSYTYEEYANLKAAPSPEELFEMILDNDPITELWHCGSQYAYPNLEETIMTLTETGDFKGCVRLK
jgi:hypothetical protein